MFVLPLTMRLPCSWPRADGRITRSMIETVTSGIATRASARCNIAATYTFTDLEVRWSVCAQLILSGRTRDHTSVQPHLLTAPHFLTQGCEHSAEYLAVVPASGAYFALGCVPARLFCIRASSFLRPDPMPLLQTTHSRNTPVLCSRQRFRGRKALCCSLRPI